MAEKKTAEKAEPKKTVEEALDNGGTSLTGSKTVTLPNGTVVTNH